MRHYIGFTERGASVRKNVRTDTTGEPLIYLDQDEQKQVVLDYTAFLGTGETISSATSVANSVTASLSVASPLITVTLSNATAYERSEGTVTITVTFSTGDKSRIVLRVRRANRFDDEIRNWDYA